MTILAEPKWLSELRNEADGRIETFPFPSERDEEWRYTDLAQYKIDTSDFQDSEVMLDGEARGVIFTDLLSAVMNQPDIVRKYLGKAVKISDKFSAIHYANIANGVIVVVPRGMSARLSARISGSCHTIIVVEKGGRLEYTEEYVGNGFSTDAVEIFAEEDSKIDFLSVQNCELTARKFSFKEAKLKARSILNWSFVSKGGAFHRVKINNILEGEGASAELVCGSRSRGRQHMDFMVNAVHTVPNTHNNILMKATADGSSSHVFRGVIKIEKAAQGTNSFLEDHALLLSEEATANNIPGLLIDANDVKAKHGATVGQIDDEQLFYLMSRGLSREDAEKLIVEGFFESVTSRITSDSIREKFRGALCE